MDKCSAHDQHTEKLGRVTQAVEGLAVQLQNMADAIFEKLDDIAEKQATAKGIELGMAKADAQTDKTWRRWAKIAGIGAAVASLAYNAYQLGAAYFHAGG